MFDVALMPVNDIDQMLAHVFAGRNASDLVCGVGQKGLELGTDWHSQARSAGRAQSVGGTGCLTVADSSFWRTETSQDTSCGGTKRNCFRDHGINDFKQGTWQSSRLNSSGDSWAK